METFKMVAKIKNYKLIGLYIFIISIVFTLNCGDKKSTKPVIEPSINRISNIAISSINYENTYVKVVYGQPYRRGRDIFGEWEPYGEVWRTGANEATEITITNTILMNNEPIDAGTYSLYTIPNEDHWTIILNNALGEWGAFNYTPDLDYKRLDIPVKKLDNPVEVFTIEFEELSKSMTTMILEWDYSRIEIPVRFY